MATLRIRRIAKMKGFSNRRLAKALGMDEANLRKILKPSANLTIRTLERVSKVLRVKIRLLIDE